VGYDGQQEIPVTSMPQNLGGENKLEDSFNIENRPRRAVETEDIILALWYQTLCVYRSLLLCQSFRKMRGLLQRHIVRRISFVAQRGPAAWKGEIPLHNLNFFLK
jgi:hypothetical protein